VDTSETAASNSGSQHLICQPEVMSLRHRLAEAWNSQSCHLERVLRDQLLHPGELLLRLRAWRQNQAVHLGKLQVNRLQVRLIPLRLPSSVQVDREGDVVDEGVAQAEAAARGHGDACRYQGRYAV